ncbi:alpha/beta hydrolase [Pigmentiphaga aceris]|uniref:Alpha/beta hydrolase n=1 Tax=Pigmentiphaga aceris TaxID=1940612 RepID=A0A5C0B114_9BURK|nr:alpha/beta hydrolase [Pigmentiphaga aceris]QEI06810.1 alpha/beta hydrolase [Pigmentiphaga aceris]
MREPRFPSLQHPRPLAPKAADLINRIHRAGRAPFWQRTPEDARDFYEKSSPILDLNPAPVADVRSVLIPVAGGQIDGRLYTGTGTDVSKPTPLLIYSHGGGFTLGGLESFDSICRMLANGLQARVLSLDYRLAPTHRFPTAADDVFNAWRWVWDRAEQLGIDRTRIAGMGDSAGGTLTAQAAIRARDAGMQMLAHVLVYPGTCAWQDTPSHAAYGDGYLLDTQTVKWFFGNYLRDDADRKDWRFAVLDAPHLAGLPPCLLQLAECDPLVDEGIAYANRLDEAGVQVDMTMYEGMAHAFYNMGGALAASRQAHRDTVAWLSERFNRF